MGDVPLYKAVTIRTVNRRQTVTETVTMDQVEKVAAEERCVANQDPDVGHVLLPMMIPMKIQTET